MNDITMLYIKFMIDYDGVEDSNLCGFFMEADFPDETRGRSLIDPTLIYQLLSNGRSNTIKSTSV